jgi:hypothetical protein
MFLRETKARRASGAEVTYLQLVESVWDSEKGRPSQRLIYSFGRADQLDLEGLRRLVGSLAKYLPEGIASVGPDRRITATQPIGVTQVVRGLWSQLGLDRFFARRLEHEGLLPRYADALLGMVLNRCVDPRSKLGTCTWLRSDAVHFPPAEGLQLQDFYRTLDFVLPHKDALERLLCDRLLDLFNMEVDLVFYDTTSSYFETTKADGFRQYGHSKDHRADLPQIVVGLAVNRDALPLRHWVHKGSIGDPKTVISTLHDLKQLKLSRVVFVGDRAMGGRKNLQALRNLKIPYLIGMKLRRTKVAKQLLSHPGRYHEALETLETKEIQLDDQRFVICRNPEAVERDRHVRENILRQIEKDLADPKTAKKAARHRVKRRFIRSVGNGYEIDLAKVREEQRLDGKSIVLIGDDSLSGEEAAIGYRGRERVEAAFRSIKSFVELRPIEHRLEERIRAHVLVCVLAYLVERLVEVRIGRSWPVVRDELQALTAVTWEGADAVATQTRELRPSERTIFEKLCVAPPPQFLSLSPLAGSSTDPREDPPTASSP